MAPTVVSTSRSRLKKSAATAPDRMSGSVTISTSGVPARLKSRHVPVAASGVSCSDLPASSSMWTRVMRTSCASPSNCQRTRPASANGRSYCEIW